MEYLCTCGQYKYSFYNNQHLYYLEAESSIYPYPKEPTAQPPEILAVCNRIDA